MTQERATNFAVANEAINGNHENGSEHTITDYINQMITINQKARYTESALKE
jgi:hypothetical protein